MPNGWQSMATAPRDGTHIPVVYRESVRDGAGYLFWCEAFWDSAPESQFGNVWRVWRNPNGLQVKPLWWFDLPPMPVAQDG